MGLRWRLLLLFLLAAFVPFVALGLVVQKTLVEELEEDHRRLLESRVEAARRRLAEREAEDRRAVQALCDHDLVIDRLLLDLATDRFDPSREQSLVTLLPPLMRGRRFDTLHLLDARSGRDRGRVLGAGHYPESVGADAAALLDATVRARGEPFVRDVRIATEAGPRDRRTLLQGCVAERDGVAVGVVAGRHLDEGFGEALLGVARFQARDVPRRSAKGHAQPRAAAASTRLCRESRGEALRKCFRATWRNELSRCPTSTRSP